MTHPVSNEDKERRARAQGRWKLLRAALFKTGCESLSTYSIHRFAGYKLISPNQVDKSLLLPGLLRIESRDELLVSLEAVRALDPSVLKWEFVFTTKLTAQQRKHMISHGLPEWVDECKWITPQQDAPWRLEVVLKQPTRTSYKIQCYALPNNNNTVVYTRERIPSARKSLDELVSHHHHDDIDNTGNICIWDCAKTLTWYLSRQQQQSAPPDIVLEVGAGMAGLAALSCWGTAQELYVTDGHQDCVWNNRINVRLLQAASDQVMSKTRVHCQLLPWSYHDATEPLQADWTLVSDCTHFEEWHGPLLWTVLWHTRVGGFIWMCQPDRGTSWERFDQVVAAVNQQNATVLMVTEQEDAILEQQHAQYLQTDPTYQPDIHRPRIFRLQKMREVTLQDQQVIQKHIQERDKARASSSVKTT